MQVIKIKDLKDYCLFSNDENKLISKALLISLEEIIVYINENLSGRSLIQLFDSNHEQVDNLTIRLFEQERKIVINGSFKTKENYIVKIGNETQYVILNPEPGGILDTIYFCDDEDFGAKINNGSVKFKVWSPPAIQIELLLYNHNQQLIETPACLFLHCTKPGIWEIEIDPYKIGLDSLESCFYQYKVMAYGKQHLALDPYALSMAFFNVELYDSVGKAAILNINSPKAVPSGFRKNYTNFQHISDVCDLIVYEINVRDFTIEPGTVDQEIAGTFKGFLHKSDYLHELGITHIQLMPVNKAYTQNEQNKEFTGKKSKHSNYNWGYDPMHYFTLEGRYSTNPNDPYCRIFEFRELIQNMHDKGIGVILDIVFNHTYLADTFETIAPGCYYRLTTDYRISDHTGAGATIESRRKQVGKLFIDVLNYFVKEFHIDGFRFDLMSFMDIETLKQIRTKVGRCYNPENPDELILHGEAWNFTDIENQAFTKSKFESLNIGIFNDSFRDSVSGNSHYYGFIQGNVNETGRLASGIVGGIKTYDNSVLPFDLSSFFNPYNLFAKEPGDCLNYLSVHDGLTLWDKLNISYNGDRKERLNLMKFAYSILFTSQGKIILHGGDEILRTKPPGDYDTEKHRAITSDSVTEEENSLYFHENSYCSNDYTNMFRWSRLTNEYSKDAHELLEYTKGLIAFRRAASAFRYKNAELIEKNLIFLDPDGIEKNQIHSFNSYKLEKFTIIFINGKPFDTCWLIGEIHKENPNPVNNPYKIIFDETGTARITFKKSEIEQFDLEKWENRRTLNIKLVKTPGNWDYLENAYSNFGDNALCPEMLNDRNEITIDLRVQDYKALSVRKENKVDFIAFSVKDINHDCGRMYLVIYNPFNHELAAGFSSIDLTDATTIVDSNHAGIDPILNSDVKISGRTVYLPGKSTAVLRLKSGL